MCFVAGTTIVTELGDKPIENIKVGDKVYSQNVDTGEKGYKEVKNVFVKEASTLVHLEVDGIKIDATETHPFWVEGKGWVEAGGLKVGDKITLETGKKARVESVTIEKLDKPVKVYNFEVEDWHTYFVSEIGVLVHNECMANPKVAGDPVSRVYDPSKPMSPSNYPNPDPDFTAPPVRYEPKTIEEVERMRKGKGPTTKATDGDRNIEAHHRGQKSVENNGGILDDLEEYTHRRDGNHTRHTEPSELTPAQRAKEIREYWKKRGSEYILPGEGI